MQSQNKRKLIVFFLLKSAYCHVSMAEILNYGQPNAMGSALNTWQIPQTAREPYITLIKIITRQRPMKSILF